jgi:tetratricopeptide (TPR) repeat protein
MRFTGFTRFSRFAATVGATAMALTTAGASLSSDVRRQPDDPPTFSSDIAPILFSRCSVCHHDGGAAPFSVLTYASVRQHTTLIAELTLKRVMPPWKAEPGYGEFVGLEPLTRDQIDLIQRWVSAGSPEGDPRALPDAPQWNADWQLGTPDLIVTLPQPYTVPAEGGDRFRIFVFPLRVDGTKYVRGIEFHPGNRGVVHHATIRVDNTPTSRLLDEDDPAPGYEGLLAHSAGYPDGHFLGWTPGQVPPLLPKGLAWHLTRGADLVVQLHLVPTGKAEPVQPSVGLYFSNDPPERTPAMIRLSRQNLDIPAGERAYHVTDSYVLPVDVDVQAVQPHAHYRGREIKGVATLPDGTTKWLIYIKDWDFRWQHVYRLVKPMPLPRGTRVEMQYTYDNSSGNPRNTQPLQRVLWGQRSSDEMGDLWIQVLTANERDLAALNNDFRPKMLAEDIVGTELLIRAEPARVALHDDVALLYLAMNQPERAVDHFDASAKLKPESAVTHFNLATALTVAASTGRDVQMSGGRLDQAIGEYQKALQIRPDYASAHNNLGSVLLQRGNPSQAIVHLMEAVRIDPRSAEARYNLGRAYRAQGNRAAAIDSFRETVRLMPNNAPALNDLASLLATAPEDALRNGLEAKRLAQLAVRLSGGQDPAALDTLAAACAEAGEFDAAVEYAQLALQHAPPGRAATLIAERLDLYKQRKAYRSP